jgi:hypothetical protein
MKAVLPIKAKAKDRQSVLLGVREAATKLSSSLLIFLDSYGFVVVERPL